MTLSEYLKSNGIRLTDFANRCDTSVGYMHDIVNGRRTPSLPLTLKILNQSGGKVDIATLLDREKTVKAAF